MPDYLELRGTKWSGLLVCPGIYFKVNIIFSGADADPYRGSFEALGPRKVRGRFDASLTGSTLRFRSATADIELTFDAQLTRLNEPDQWVIYGLGNVRTRDGIATGVLAAFTGRDLAGLEPWGRIFHKKRDILP